jgi:hypothetical protein
MLLLIAAAESEELAARACSARLRSVTSSPVLGSQLSECYISVGSGSYAEHPIAFRWIRR